MPERFWAKVRKGDGCWLWQGTRGAHRVAWMLTNGMPPDGALVLHRCDTPACVRPDHLFLGSHQDNSDDKMNKGRDRKATGDRSSARLYPERVPRGERHGRARFTKEQVESILERHARGERTASIARSLGAPLTTVDTIVHRKAWAHLSPRSGV